jgi:iron(III) transport system ATP-binding protein
VLRDLSLTVEPGELFFLLGPSGCGKSTLLRIAAGLIEPDSGRILADGKDISLLPPERRGMPMVFQSYALWPHMDVFENVAFGLKIRKMPASEIRTRVESILEAVQMTPYIRRKITALSGGQQQRVALARALCIEPDVLLMDEPLSNLDAKLRVEMRTVIKNIQHNVGITTVYVTHDQEEAMAVSDRIAVMNSGVIQQIGTPKAIYQRPANLFVSTFIGRSNILNGTLEVEDGKTWIVTKSGYKAEIKGVRDEQKKNQNVILSVRPEEFLLDRDATAGIEAVVDDCVFLGLNTHYFVHLSSGEEVEIIQESSIDSIIEPGSHIRLTLNTEKVNVFTEDGSENILTGVHNDRPES